MNVELKKPDATIDGNHAENGSALNQSEKPKEPKLVSNSKSKAVKSSTITPASSSVHDRAISTQSQVNRRDEKNSTVNGKKEEDSPTENKKSNKQGEVPWGRKGAAVGGKKQKDVRTESNKLSELLTTPKPKVDTTANTNNRYTVVSISTKQSQSGPSEAMRNGTNNSTTQNRTGAASSPSQNKASRGDKSTVHKGTVQSTAESSVAGQKHNKLHAAPSTHRPAPPPPTKHDRVQGKSSLPPTQSLPLSSAATKHERIQVKSSLPSLGEKTRELGRPQKSTNAVSYKTKTMQSMFELFSDTM